MTTVKKIKESRETIVSQEQTTIDHQYQLDHQMVKGVFRNLAQKNSPLRFPFRKYKQDPIKFYPLDVNGRPNYFVDGQTYEIPLMVANYLNNKCYREVLRTQLPQHGNFTQNQQRDSYGNFVNEPAMETVEKKHRFMFVNTDFKPVKGWEEPSTLS